MADIEAGEEDIYIKRDILVLVRDLALLGIRVEGA